MRDKFSAIWISYSSIGDYLKCPRAYYLKNIYRDPTTNRKMTVIEPPLVLGQVVHGVIEEISVLPQAMRFEVPLSVRFERLWQGVTGEAGGFTSVDEENKYKARGVSMIANLDLNRGPLEKPAIKIRSDLPNIWLTEEDNIILCGKIDWLEYMEATDSVRIIDFKTGRLDENEDSLQLPIYILLAQHTQKRPVTGAAYWYVEKESAPYDLAIPDLESARKNLLDIGKKIELARKLERFVCKQKEGCAVCMPFENILLGKAKKIKSDEYNRDIYILPKSS